MHTPSAHLFSLQTSKEDWKEKGLWVVLAFLSPRRYFQCKWLANQEVTQIRKAKIAFLCQCLEAFLLCSEQGLVIPESWDSGCSTRVCSVEDVTCLPCSLTYVELPGTRVHPEFCPQRACECCRWTGHQGTLVMHTARSSSFAHMPSCPTGLHLQSTCSKTKLLTSRWWRQSIKKLSRAWVWGPKPATSQLPFMEPALSIERHEIENKFLHLFLPHSHS